jgi:hypothetical protein
MASSCQKEFAKYGPKQRVIAMQDAVSFDTPVAAFALVRGGSAALVGPTSLPACLPSRAVDETPRLSTPPAFIKS